MGWTYIHREPEQPIREVFEKEFNYKDEKTGRQLRVLDCAVKGIKEAYLAIEETLPTGKRHVFGMVCLLDYYYTQNGKYYHNFGYKDIEESMGPTACNCPKRILDLLTPTENEYALKWRKNCRERIEREKKLRALREGDLIRFKEELYTPKGHKARIFRLIKKNGLWFTTPEVEYLTVKLSRRTFLWNDFDIIKREE